MRKIATIFFFTLMLLVTKAEARFISQPDSVRYSPDKIKLFFAPFGLNVDSVQNPDLFGQVYYWIGTRYQYAGHTKKGIDCSGFVTEMYRTSFCIALSGGSKDLYGAVDTVARKDLREGDILFFKIRKGQVSHVGIYLGNNKFAHASVQAGVIVSDLNEAYYKKYYFTAGRIKNPKLISH